MSRKPITPPLAGHRDLITSASYSHDGRYVVTTSRDHEARIWDAQTGRLLLPPLAGSDAQINSAAFSYDDRWVVTAGPAATRVLGMLTGRRPVSGLWGGPTPPPPALFPHRVRGAAPGLTAGVGGASAPAPAATSVT